VPLAKQIKHMKKYLPALFLPLVLAACKDNPEQIPAYLRLEPFAVNAQGDAQFHRITEGWLYLNGEFLGAYTLPATVPVLARGEGQDTVLVFPGVKENGIEATPNIYPFLARYERLQPVLTAAQTTAIQANTSYLPNTEFAFGVGRGDFDGGSFISLINLDGDPATTFELTEDGAFAGKCIRAAVDTASPTIDFATEELDELPTTGGLEVWLEMHYRSDLPFAFSLYGTDANGTNEEIQPVYAFNATEDAWKKIYLNLTEFLAASGRAKYRLAFRVTLPKDNAGQYTQNSGIVRLDNLRVLHF
jgi:hypothetical protein